MNNDDLIKVVGESIELGTIKITDIPKLKKLVDKAIQSSVNTYTAQHFNSFSIQQQLTSLVDQATKEQVNQKSDFINENNQILYNQQKQTQQNLNKINNELEQTQKTNEAALEKAHDLQARLDQLNRKLSNNQKRLNDQNESMKHYDKLVNNRYFIFAVVLFAMVLGIIIGVVFL